MPPDSLITIGHWTPDGSPPRFAPADLSEAIGQFRRPVHIIRNGPRGPLGLGSAGTPSLASQSAVGGPQSDEAYPLLATLPALYPEWLGDRSFLDIHGVRFPYVAGAMANGIATADLVIAMARAEMIGFFGSGGLAPGKVADAIDEIMAALGDGSSNWGANLIHSPNEPAMEEQIVDLYLSRGVRRISAAAYMRLTPPLVRFACTGLTEAPDGTIERRNYVFAKLSRPEVARHFLAPAPRPILDGLVASGLLTESEASLASHVPLAEDITVEADSGGHTDNRPLAVLLPTIMAQRDQAVADHGYRRPIRVGAAGGLGCPAAVAAAFSLGAAYVLTGSVNQSAQEAGLAPVSKQLLAQAGIADVAMAPSPDMFELGVKVQVLKRGTLFAARANQLFDLYRSHDSIEAIPAALRQRLEQEIFKGSLDQVWRDTQAYFGQRAPAEIERAERDPKHRMALVFRWYIGRASRWAIAGDEGRRSDYQIWCGPAMGAFNAWAKGSFLEDRANRTVAQIARNLLEGAAQVTRAQQLRSYGLPVPETVFNFRPRPLR
jgi:trans-AT polyketide synthase/acyltransferase/oxidoreductase domain-containing protein